MAFGEAANGTQLSVISTEHTLATLTAGIYVLKVDKNAMQNGDTLELRIYDQVLASGSLRVAYETSYTNAQPADDMISISVPVPCFQAFKATLKQTAGSPRSYPWDVITL